LAFTCCNFAEFELVRVIRLATTISFVVFAGAVIVASITNTVASPVRVTACAAAPLNFRCIGFVVGIQTLAFSAELELILFFGIAAAVTLIPVTTTVVVVVVADAIVGPAR